MQCFKLLKNGLVGIFNSGLLHVVFECEPVTADINGERVPNKISIQQPSSYEDGKILIEDQQAVFQIHGAWGLQKLGCKATANLLHFA